MKVEMVYTIFHNIVADIQTSSIQIYDTIIFKGFWVQESSVHWFIGTLTSEFWFKNFKVRISIAGGTRDTSCEKNGSTCLRTLINLNLS